MNIIAYKIKVCLKKLDFVTEQIKLLLKKKKIFFNFKINRNQVS